MSDFSNYKCELYMGVGTGGDREDMSPQLFKGKRSKEKIDLIDVINDLQLKLIASGHSLNVSLPQIVVVGSQSAGKSSVLESFVGRKFLPRGKDTVTRRPTIIQMFTSTDEYAIFAHKPEEKFTDFEEVKEEIQNETLRHPGPTGFSSDPISLKIYSPRVLKLTVVDLPGLIKNVEDGHAQSSIQIVRNMVLKEIEPEESLILAVTPATQDIVTSDAMEIAKEVDPKRERTIGVLTKLDALNDGTDARDVLENQKIYLKKGYVGVVNRNQKEIEEKRDFHYILNKEKYFFENHPAYKDIADVQGIPYLVRMLQKTLRAHIKQFLPIVRNDISKKLAISQKELKHFEKKIGYSIGPNRFHDRQYYIIKLIQNFTQNVEIQLTGHSELVDAETFSAGAMINYMLSTEIKRNLTLTMIPDESQLSMLIVNMAGLRVSVSIPDFALHALNQTLLKKFKDPMENSVHGITEVMKICMEDIAKSLDRYPQLKNEVLLQIENCIDQEAESTTEKLLSHIEANMYYINYNHPVFDSSVCDPIAPTIGPIKLWENVSAEDETAFEDVNVSSLKDEVKLPNKSQMQKALTCHEDYQKNIKYSSTLLMKYIEHVQRQMVDVAIKYIIFFLVKKVLDFIKIELLPTVLGSSNFESIMEDCEDDFRWKEETEATCRILRETLAAIREF